MKRLTDNVLLFGNGNFNYYVVGNKEAALIECGMSAGVSIFANQWSQLKKPPEVKYILALHSHFDHVCGIPMLKEMFPAAQVLASLPTMNVFSLDKVLGVMKRADNIVSDEYVKAGLLDEKPITLDTKNLTVDRALHDGEHINLSDDLEMTILETPGHSPCSIAVYLEKDQVMFVSDAAGYRLSEGLMSPVFFQDYDLYINSIKKLMAYSTSILGVGHGNVPIGTKEVDAYYQQSLASCYAVFADIKDKLETGIGEEAIAEQLFNTFIKDAMAYYPADMMLGSMYQLIKNVRSRI